MPNCTARLLRSLPGDEQTIPEDGLPCCLEAGHYSGPTPDDPEHRAGSWHCDTDPPAKGSRVWADTAQGAIPHNPIPETPGPALTDDLLELGETLLDDRATRGAVWRVVYAAIGGAGDPSLTQARAVARQLLADGWHYRPDPTPLRDEDPSGSPSSHARAAQGPGYVLRAWQVGDRAEVYVLASLGVVLEAGAGPVSGLFSATVIRVSSEDLEVELDEHGPRDSRVTLVYGVDPDGSFSALRPLERDACGCEGPAHSCGNPGTTP